MTDTELFLAEGYDDGVVTEVIRPAAVIPEECARTVLEQLSVRDVTHGGLWQADPSRWARYDRPWAALGDPGDAQLIGTIQVVYGMPTKYEITVYRATITRYGTENGWSVIALCDEALGFGGLDLATCPRAPLAPPPKPFRF